MIIIKVGSIIAGFAVSTSVFSKTLKFEDYLQSFRIKNAEVVTAVRNEEAAAIRSESIYSLYLPQLQAGQLLSLSRPNNSHESSFDLSKSTSRTLEIAGFVPHFGLTYRSTLIDHDWSRTFKDNKKTSDQSTSDLSFELSLKLLKGFGPAVGDIPFSRAKLLKALASQNRVQVTLSQAVALINAYNSVYVHKSNLEISRKLFRNNEVEIQKAQQRYKEGSIPHLSLLSLQAQNQSLKLNILFISRSLRQSLTELHSLAGVESSDLNIEDVEFKPISLHERFLEKFKEWLGTGFVPEKSKNPDLQITRMNLRLAEINVTEAKNNTLPDLSLNGGIVRSSSLKEDFLPDDGQNKVISLTLLMPIGFIAERAEYRPVKLELAAKRNEFVQVSRRLSISWSNLVEQYALVTEQLQIIRGLVSLAQKQYESSIPTASLGSTYQTNVINFQNQLLSAQRELYQAEISVLNVMIDIYAFHGSMSFIDLLR